MVKLQLKITDLSEQYLVVIQVRDTGIGIKQENINNIFKGFYQVDHTTTRAYGGSGLGLAISQKLVQLMNGELSVTSTLGKGSTFTLKIPLTPSSDLAHTTPKKIVKDYDKNVLVVDDTPSNQLIAKALLTKLGFSVTIADNGKAAITQLLNHQFDLIFMDMHMPILDGIEATKQIRCLNTDKADIPIIALTANVLPEDQSLCLQAGMNGVITKPVTKDKIIVEVDKAFSFYSSESADDILLQKKIVIEN